MALDNEDAEILLSIGRSGVELEGRVIPVADRTNIMDILEKEFSKQG